MNSPLVPVFHGDIDSRPQQLCDARHLHAFLGVGRFFSTWIKERVEQYGFVEGEDFLPVLAKSTGGRPCQEYHLTLDMAKELAMVENNDQGRQVRRYFITMEREARESLGASYLSVNQQLAIHKQVPVLLTKLKAETVPAIRQTLHAQLSQHCHLLSLPVPAIDAVGSAVIVPATTTGGNADLFSEAQQ
ncbi:antA/AntB antirepressor family protein [Pseudomonas viridiflava]|uniref:antA/AntB antirepressor family protein n=1 Tax=Pseudomonas viridiflava TaxID=33069 RepID=UPI001F613956|nr:antA/AntB antirepressor family protein [Pseudomonas viridiflava]MCI3908828.1 antA/AntB antirepressor family protein [Pseudomonas viridiflava]